MLLATIGNYTIIILAMNRPTFIDLLSDSEEPLLHPAPLHPLQLTSDLTPIELKLYRSDIKSIFIAILDYLDIHGLRSKCEASLGARQIYYSMGDVPLKKIYEFISQQWFVSEIDTCEIMDFIGKKIMLSSRISRKLVQLELARLFFRKSFKSQDTVQVEMSWRITDLKTEGMEQDELFAFPSIIHYLLYFMVRFLDHHLCLQVELPGKENRFQGGRFKKNIMGYISAGTELHSYALLIDSIFSSPFIYAHHIVTLHTELANSLIIREQEIQEKHQLPITIIDWKLFMVEVADKCFRSKYKNGKVCMKSIERWIKNFSKLYVKNCCHCTVEKLAAMRSPEMSNSSFNEESTSFRTIFVPQEFAPLILQASSQCVSFLEFNSP